MSISLTEDIRSVTELKRHTRDILQQVRRTGRPIVLTVSGRADAVLLDVKTYENHLCAAKMAGFLEEAEKDVTAGKTRPMRKFLKEFRHARKI